MADAKRELQLQRAAAARFFVRVEQHGQATLRCDRTLPLFPLWLILAADGTLASELTPLVARTQA